MMPILIESMNQRMDFQTKEVSNTLVLRLPSGAFIEVNIEDDAVTKLLNEVAGGAEVPEEPAAVMRMNHEGVSSFGGNPTPPQEPPLVTRAPVVRRDAGGNPILAGDGFRSPEAILGTDDVDRDEDGVSQA